MTKLILKNRQPGPPIGTMNFIPTSNAYMVWNGRGWVPIPAEVRLEQTIEKLGENEAMRILDWYANVKKLCETNEIVDHDFKRLEATLKLLNVDE